MTARISPPAKERSEARRRQNSFTGGLARLATARHGGQRISRPPALNHSATLPDTHDYGHTRRKSVSNLASARQPSEPFGLLLIRVTLPVKGE
jgi:hypothetical protein